MPKVRTNVEIASTHIARGDPCDVCFNERQSFAENPDPARLRLVGCLPRRDGDSPAILVRFDAKPTMSPSGTIHYPLSQQVEPEWATVVRTNARCLERVPEGARVLVKAHMNGDKLEGTDLHWLTEEDVLGVWEDDE